MQANLTFPVLTATLSAALTVALTAQTPQYVVAPANHTSTDALAYEWIAGASQPLRQQTLVGQSHLQLAVGSSIQAIELRRTAVIEMYQGGSMDLVVTLSTSPNTPVQCDNHWSSNVGQDVVTVFSGTVTLPNSPIATGHGLGTPVAWTPDNTLRIAFTQPFAYLGGTLCVDVTGTPIGGQEANWWMADAAEEVILGGSAVDIGSGCGIYGGPTKDWSTVAVRTLVPGMRAQLWAYGTPDGLALAVLGRPALQPIPLSVFGIPTPNCYCHLDIANVFAVLPAMFEADPPPSNAIDGIAEALVPLPAHPACYGLQLTTQWFDLTQMATSNAITWTVAASTPTLDMALNEGHPAEAKGLVTSYLAHVMRFEFQ